MTIVNENVDEGYLKEYVTYYWRSLPIAEIQRISEHIGSDWKQLGRALGLSKTDLDGIEEENRFNLRDRIHGLFHLWKQRKGPDATVQQLKKGVVDSGLNLPGYPGPGELLVC